MKRFSPKQLKITGLIVLLIPMVILAVFTVGETAGGDISGLQHVVQALPLILLAVLAWKQPQLGGWLIAVVAGGLAIWYAIDGPNSNFTALLAAEALLFLPAVIAGVLLIASAKVQQGASHEKHV